MDNEIILTGSKEEITQFELIKAMYDLPDDIKDAIIEVKNRGLKIMTDFYEKFFEHDYIDRHYKIFDIYTQGKITCVYFVKDEISGLTKIGKSNNFLHRYGALKSLCRNYMGGLLKAERLILCSTIENSEIENKLHKHYSKVNKHGEWFDLRNISYDDDYFDDGLVINFDGNDIFIDTYYEDAIDYELRKDLQSSIATSRMFKQFYRYDAKDEVKNSKINKLFEYMRDNEIGFSVATYKRLGLYSTLRLSENTKYITLEDAYNKQISLLLK